MDGHRNLPICLPIPQLLHLWRLAYLCQLCQLIAYLQQQQTESPESQLAAPKPPLGQKSADQGDLKEKPLVTPGYVKENLPSVRRSTSSVPIFANGAVSAGFAYLFSSAANSNSRQQAKTLTVSDLQPGDVLLTGEGGLATVLKGFGDYGHGGVVLSVNGDVVTVLSADERGFYIETNMDKFVGGRSWDVFRVSGIDTIRLGTFANNLPLGGGAGQYFGNSGGNVCSSTVARAIEFSGGPSASRLFGNLVTPNELARTYGPSIGHLQMPLIGGSP